MKVLTAMFCFILASALTVFAQSKPDKKADEKPKASSPDSASTKDQLKKMEEDRAQAVVNGDTAALDKTTTDDYTLVDMNGRVSGKADMMSRIKSGDLKLTRDKVDDMSVHIYGSTAVVTGTATVSGKVAGKSVTNQQLRFTRVWVKRNNQWVSAAFQQTAVSK
jgi:ketosteroid isomerase-like protein